MLPISATLTPFRLPFRLSRNQVPLLLPTGLFVMYPQGNEGYLALSRSPLGTAHQAFLPGTSPTRSVSDIKSGGGPKERLCFGVGKEEVDVFCSLWCSCTADFPHDPTGGDRAKSGSCEHLQNPKRYFSPQDPTLLDLHPHFGPIAGGTRLTIAGEELLTGTEIVAYVGDRPCLL